MYGPTCGLALSQDFLHRLEKTNDRYAFRRRLWQSLRRRLDHRRPHRIPCGCGHEFFGEFVRSFDEPQRVRHCAMFPRRALRQGTAVPETGRRLDLQRLSRNHRAARQEPAGTFTRRNHRRERTGSDHLPHRHDQYPGHDGLSRGVWPSARSHAPDHHRHGRSARRRHRREP
jgi:hypothetical protein